MEKMPLFKEKYSLRLIIRYSLLQLPGIALVIGIMFLVKRFVDIPFWLLWFIPLAWVAKDIILFPFVWRAYDWDQKDKGLSIIGMHGIVSDRLKPTGYILIRGELWKAEAMEKELVIEKGQKVRVHGIHGLTLHVKPVDDKNSE